MPVTYLILIIFCLLLIQASWIFYDANKRVGHKWLWGLFGLTNVPSALIIYLIITRIIMKEETCPHCLYKVNHKAEYCSSCGEKINQ